MPWMANTAYALGATIIPTTGGYIYTAIVAGTSSNFPPNFPTARGATVLDGSSNLAAKHLFYENY